MLVNVHDEELILPPAISTGLKNIIAQQSPQSSPTSPVQPPDTVSTQLGQAVLTTDGNPPSTTIPTSTERVASPVTTPSPVIPPTTPGTMYTGWAPPPGTPPTVFGGLPTSPVITPLPSGNGTVSGGGLIAQLSSALSATPTAASFLSSTVRSFLPPPAVTAAGGSVAPTIAGSALAQVNAHLSATTQRVTLENQINSLSSTRVAAETQLVSLKMQEIQADMQRVAAHQNLLATIRNTTNSGNALEDLMNNLYQTRSRQGFGGFTGEISNPV